MDHLNDVIASVCPDSQIAASIQCKRTKATCITKHAFGTYFYQSLAKTLRNSPFSVIIDETTDIAAIKEMCIITRYYNDETSKVESRFFGLIEVPQANAETLFQSLTNHFEQFNVPFTNIIGYAADGANTMMGRNSSVKTRMEAANPSIFVMHCTCHSAHLAASYACATLLHLQAGKMYGYLKNPHFKLFFLTMSFPSFSISIFYFRVNLPISIYCTARFSFCIVIF